MHARALKVLELFVQRSLRPWRTGAGIGSTARSRIPRCTRADLHPTRSSHALPIRSCRALQRGRSPMPQQGRQAGRVGPREAVQGKPHAGPDVTSKAPSCSPPLVTGSHNEVERRWRGCPAAVLQPESHGLGTQRPTRLERLLIRNAFTTRVRPRHGQPRIVLKCRTVERAFLPAVPEARPRASLANDPRAIRMNRGSGSMFSEIASGEPTSFRRNVV